MRCQLALSYSLTRIDLIARRSSTQAPAPGDIHSRASHAYTHTHTHTHTHTPPPPTHTHTHTSPTHTHTQTHTHTHTHTHFPGGSEGRRQEGVIRRCQHPATWASRCSALPHRRCVGQGRFLQQEAQGQTRLEVWGQEHGRGCVRSHTTNVRDVT
jgi:hypothetical protein